MGRPTFSLGGPSPASHNRDAGLRRIGYVRPAPGERRRRVSETVTRAQRKLDPRPSERLAYSQTAMEPPMSNMTPPKGAAKTYALRFISGKYQGGEFPLPAEGEIVIGRSSELDMVLVEDMVSRRHAKITVTGGQIFIQDLGSTNGSFVNGEKIKRARLNEGDRILVGTSIIKLVATEGPANLNEAKAHLEDVASGKRTSQVRTMTGSIAEVPLPDLLQLFAASKKSGVLVIRTEREVGKVFLDKGRVVYSCVNDNYDVSPLKSFYRIVTWEQGTFDMEPPEEREFPEQIDMSTEGLLMEAMRILDEVKRLGPDMPPMNASIALAVPMIPPLRDLSPEQLDVLQLAHNYGVVESVLNKSLANDVETSQILVNLIRSGYLKT